VHGLIEQARRRIFLNHMLSQGVNALCAALLALIVLLVAGADILGWRWLAAIPAATLVAGAWRAWRRVPARYGAAQLVDRRLGLMDALSTAVHFEKADAAGSDSMREGQRCRAEAVAAQADVRCAVPFSMPRASYATAALALVATSLFAVRYGAQHRLDLHTPLARILGLPLAFEHPAERARKTPPPPEAAQPPEDEQDSDAAGAVEKGRPRDASGKQEQAGSQSPEAGRKAAGNSGKEGQRQQQAGREERQGEEEAQAESRQPSEADNSRDNSGQQGKEGGKRQQSRQGAPQQNESSGPNSSLMAKVKDAVQNLLAKINPQQNSRDAQQQRQNQQQAGKENRSPQQQQGGGEQQASQDGKQDGGQQGGAQVNQNGQQARNGQDPAGKGQGKSDSNQGTKQPGSGIGSQDGAKDIREAEQLAAMGKISESLGKRAANVTGEATVEVESTSQQLSTPYSQRGAAHTGSAAEIGRDEIPVALEAYVARYFEQVRRQAPPKK
jgi:hypothetical protein